MALACPFFLGGGEHWGFIKDELWGDDGKQPIRRMDWGYHLGYKHRIGDGTGFCGDPIEINYRVCNGGYHRG